MKEVDAEKFSVQFKHDNVRPKTLKIVDKIGFQRAIRLLNIIAHYKMAGRLEVKLTIPSPSMLHLILYPYVPQIISRLNVIKITINCY